MVVTRSERSAERSAERAADEIERERVRRRSRLPPASPSMPAREEAGATALPIAGPSAAPAAAAGNNERGEARALSPQPSVHSQRSRRTTNSTLQVRLAELEAAERLAAVKRRELEIESDLIKKKLAVQIAAAEESSLQGDTNQEDQHQRVDEWLRGATARGEGERRDPSRPTEREREREFDRRDRSLTPARTRSYGPMIAEALDRMSRPQRRYNGDLPKFSGDPSEWLRFSAAMRESTRLFRIPPVENVLRLQTALTRDALEAVSAHLMTDTTPDRIMKTLEQCFGSPESIVDKISEDIRRIPKLGLSARELNKLAVKVQNGVCALKSMDRRGCLHDPQLTREILLKLTPTLRNKWYEYAHAHEDENEADVVILSKFLMREAMIAMRYAYEPPITNVTNNSREVRQNVNTQRKKSAVYATEQEEASERSDECPKCKQQHVLTQCPEYRALSVQERWDLVKKQGMCFKCVVKKHRRLNCREQMCGVNKCRRPHHPTLHQDEKAAPAAEQVARPAKKPSVDEVVLSVAAASVGSRDILLKVCEVTVSGPKGEVQAYALLDEGATITLIDSDLAKKIGAEGPSQPLRMSGVNMSQEERESQLVTLKIRGKHEGTLFTVKARTIRNLRLREQKISPSLLRHKHLQKIPEQACYDRARPLILVGADNWELIVTRELRIGSANEPAASRTQLGWVIHGTAPRSVIYENESVLHVFTPDRRAHVRTEEHERRLHELVEQQFKIESLGVTLKPRVSDADKRAVKMFENTIREKDGAYEVGLPWCNDDVSLPPSYSAALNRLKGVERKMDRDESFAREYNAQIANLMDKGYAAPCDGNESQSPVAWFLPHFAVRNPNKPDKQRLVFDAAHRCHGTCLNDVLLEGPDLLLSLQGIIFRFREKPVAVTADIQEMFLRVKIRDEDQPAQQFLWRGSDRESPPRAYKMTSMIFGAASSPFLAHSVRDHNARAHAHSHPRAHVAITRSHYMDDYIDSHETEDEARRTIQEVREVHSRAGFTLRGWSSNAPATLSSIPDELRTSAPTRLGGAASNKVLGLFWNAESDELGFNTAMHRVPPEVRARTRAPTKREALSAVMSLYDPVGLIAQYTIRGRILLQSLWGSEMTWDEPIPDEQAERLATWLRELRSVEALKLRRSYALRATPSVAEVQLHIFCDASQEAFATVAYYRALHSNGATEVSLVAARAKVAPRRTQSIPRLELQAAVIGARLAVTIRNEHRVKVARTVLWTDSTTVVQWVRNDKPRYTPFVAHRLGELAETTQKGDWRWLPTDQNVADDATRLSTTPITSEDRWFRGPEFLYRSEEHWPKECSGGEDNEQEVLHTTEEDGAGGDWLPDTARYSRYEVLVRTVARVLLFVDACRRRATRLELRHIERAERLLFERAQRESFGTELSYLRAARPIPRSSRLHKLDPVLRDGLLRVNGRIGAADAATATKRPIILDGRHPFVKLLIDSEHRAAGHANRERIVNELRQRYWILHLRPTVRTVEHRCIFCRVKRAKPNAPIMGDLPRARLQPFHRAFSYAACDYFGPVMIKVGRRREKRWGALFTCLTTRGVHLELVASLSSSSAIMALRRMAARRGWPLQMWSDNATAFRGADKELRDAYAEWEPVLREEGLRHRMEWRYVPPIAPRQAGSWERLVRSVKTALAVTLREKAPTEEVLQTLLAEAEYAINARPLTHVSVDARDPEALTPNHFLLGSSGGLPTTGPCSEADRRTWRASQALADSFWRRWIREYLPTLVPRGESANTNKNIEVGDIVVLVDRTLPRNIWPLGVVEKTYPGPDGGVRVVDLRTKTGIFRRPAYKLAVLEKNEDGFASCAGGRVLRTPSPPPATDKREAPRRGCGRAGARLGRAPRLPS